MSLWTETNGSGSHRSAHLAERLRGTSRHLLDFIRPTPVSSGSLSTSRRPPTAELLCSPMTSPRRSPVCAMNNHRGARARLARYSRRIAARSWNLTATLRTLRGAFTEASGLTSSSFHSTPRLNAALSRRIPYPTVSFAALSSRRRERLYCSTSAARMLSIGRCQTAQ